MTKVLLAADSSIAGLGAVNNEQYTISPVKMRISGSGVGTSLTMWPATGPSREQPTSERWAMSPHGKTITL